MSIAGFAEKIYFRAKNMYVYQNEGLVWKGLNTRSNSKYAAQTLEKMILLVFKGHENELQACLDDACLKLTALVPHEMLKKAGKGGEDSIMYDIGEREPGLQFPVNLDYYKNELVMYTKFLFPNKRVKNEVSTIRKKVDMKTFFNTF